MKDLADKTAVVTGAGSGIGRATALALADQGARVAVTDLSEESAQETVELIKKQGGGATAFRLDVSKLDEIRRVAQEIETSMGTPSLLVNNAGIAVAGTFLDTGLDSWQKIMSINLMGVVHCCHTFLPAMVNSGREGHIVNIASMLGYTGIQGVTAYCTTKFGVLGFSESLRAELAAHHIGVSAICPGMIRTNIINSGILDLNDEDVEERRRFIEDLYKKRDFPPEHVAKAIVKAVRRNRAVVPVAPEAWLAYYLKRWAPWLVRFVARKVDV